MKNYKDLERELLSIKSESITCDEKVHKIISWYSDEKDKMYNSVQSKKEVRQANDIMRQILNLANKIILACSNLTEDGRTIWDLFYQMQAI